jgi:hypothetical protein
MKESTFDALTRHAGSVQDRRASLKALGAAALVATSTAPLSAEAKKSSSKKAKKKCKKQIGPCNTFSNEICDVFFDPGTEFDQCVVQASACCPSLKKCQATPFFDCALEVIIALVSVSG